MFKYKPLSPFLGVEIIHCDAMSFLNSTQTETLKQLIYQHKVVLFRQQNLSPDQQISFTKQLGNIEPVWDKNSIHPEYDLIHVISNKNRVVSNTRSASEYWHTDGSFRASPTFLTLLYAIKHPRSGGNTLFVDMQTAYETLDDSTKNKIANLSGVHSYDYLFKQMQIETMALPDIIHPLVITHPITHKKSLYLNELCLQKIDQLPSAESTTLLNQLYEHTLNANRIYTHQWQENDLLIWDNTALMHRREQTPLQLRLLHRTSVGYFNREISQIHSAL